MSSRQSRRLAIISQSRMARLLVAVTLVVPALAVQLPSRPTLLPCGCPACGRVRHPLLYSAGDGDGDDGGDGQQPQPTQAAVAALKFYKTAISPLIPPSCRFIPTCSEYGAMCYERFTIPQATLLTAWRLLRCSPLHWPGTGFGNDAPVWPPPAYWAGDGTLRTWVDDERSRRKAQGEDVDGAVWELDPLGLSADEDAGSASPGTSSGADSRSRMG